MDNPFRNAKVGDYIKFGNYPQTSNGQNQPIEWQVLAKEEKKMLLLSKYGLEAKRFDSGSNNWANSEIRKWLNGEFYNKAFNEKERKSIKSSNLSDVGTTDNVFLLSKEEAEKYFANDDERRCEATEYTKSNGAYLYNSYSYWWLRSPDPNDRIDVVYNVDDFGDIGDDDVDIVCDVVRPALWINI